MVAFLNNDVSDAWLIVLLQLDACISDSQELVMQNLHTGAQQVSKEGSTEFTMHYFPNSLESSLIYHQLTCGNCPSGTPSL